MATSTSSLSVQPPAPAPRTGTLRAPWLAARLAAALSLTTGWVHLASMGSHWDQWWGYGLFFLLVGAGQALYTIAILRWPSPSIVLFGILGNLLVVVTYVISRTAGIPWGPHADVAERTGLIDLASAGAEVVTVGALLVLAPPRMRRAGVNLMLLAGAGLWFLRLTGNLV